MLSSVPTDDRVIVADLEAGIGALTRLPDGAVDKTVVVVEPTPRSIDVAVRAVSVATERKQGEIFIVANKVDGREDRARVSAAFPDLDVSFVPTDSVVVQADRQGLSPIDLDGQSVAVAALKNLANRLAS